MLGEEVDDGLRPPWTHPRVGVYPSHDIPSRAVETFCASMDHTLILRQNAPELRAGRGELVDNRGSVVGRIVVHHHDFVDHIDLFVQAVQTIAQGFRFVEGGDDHRKT